MTGVAMQFWHWWALGGVLAIAEVFAPGFILIWLGVAAGMVGILLLVLPTLDLSIQVLLFAALSVASVVGWRRWQAAHPVVTDQPRLNRRGEHYIGQRVTLIEPIVDGRGRAKLADGTWPVTGPRLPAGQLVEIVGTDGVVLEVAPVADSGP
jgi:membrane protein implicated in regulation of membrane protease activity